MRSMGRMLLKAHLAKFFQSPFPVYLISGLLLMAADLRAEAQGVVYPWVIYLPGWIALLGGAYLAVYVLVRRPMPAPPEWAPVYSWISWTGLVASVVVLLVRPVPVVFVYVTVLIVGGGIWGTFAALGLPGWRGRDDERPSEFQARGRS